MVVETELVRHLLTKIRDQTIQQKPTYTTPRHRALPKEKATITPDTISKRKKRANELSLAAVVINSDNESLQSELEFPDKISKLKCPFPTISPMTNQQVIVLCYIFSKGFPEEEVLFDNRQHILCRSNLYTLLPEKWLNSKVITAASHRTTYFTRVKNERVVWYLPATLSKDLMTKRTPYEQAVNVYRHTTLLRNSNNCWKICVPMKDDDH